MNGDDRYDILFYITTFVTLVYTNLQEIAWVKLTLETIDKAWQGNIHFLVYQLTVKIAFCHNYQWVVYHVARLSINRFAQDIR